MEQRSLGKHEGCGGDVIYWSTRTQGHRECQKCKQSSRTGVSPEVVVPNGQTVLSVDAQGRSHIGHLTTLRTKP